MPEPVVTEIAPDVYRVSVFIPEINLQFNHFVVDDEEPLLFHTGLRDMFPLVLGGVARVVDPSRIRWISFSHTESDECGALAEWLQAAPNATPVCSQVGSLVNRDFVSAVREARGMADGEELETGKYRFRFLRTAQLPHGWDAGVLYEETQRTLLCSDLFHQNGDCEPLTESDVVERARNSLREYEAGILAAYPYHFHLAEEELLFVLAGHPSLRTPKGWRELAPGEAVAFLVGEGGAHQVVNRTDEPVRMLVVSLNGVPEICIYPDSDKVGVYGDRVPEGGGMRELYRRSEAVDYYDGEQAPARDS